MKEGKNHKTEHISAHGHTFRNSYINTQKYMKKM